MTRTEIARQPWGAIGTATALALAASGLMFTGGASIGFGMHWLGIGMLASGAAIAVVASFVEV
jgi:hypothetical protein